MVYNESISKFENAFFQKSSYVQYLSTSCDLKAKIFWLPINFAIDPLEVRKIENSMKDR